MKKILRVICAFVCVVSFATANVVNAGMPSASQQDKDGFDNLKRYAMVASNKPIAQAALSDVLPLQRRLSRPNGITITNQPFQHTDDYKTMMHPIIVGLNGDNAAAGGGGYLYIAVSHLLTDANGHIEGEIGMLKAEHSLSHEYAHNILGHSFRKIQGDYEGFYSQLEYEADIKSFDLLKGLPEGGWGVHLLGVNIASDFRFEKEQRVLDYIKKESRQYIGFNVEEYGRSNAGNPLHHITVYYDSGKDTYPLVISKQYARNAYYGGQIAYCIAKGILSPKNLRIVPNTLKYELKWDADCLLVCNDSSLPNGYRIITGLKGNQAQLQNELDRLRSSFGPANQAVMSDYYNNTFGPRIYSAQGVEQGKLILWETMAVAYDFTHK